MGKTVGQFCGCAPHAGANAAGGAWARLFRWGFHVSQRSGTGAGNEWWDAQPLSADVFGIVRWLWGGAQCARAGAASNADGKSVWWSFGGTPHAGACAGACAQEGQVVILGRKCVQERLRLSWPGQWHSMIRVGFCPPSSALASRSRSMRSLHFWKRSTISPFVWLLCRKKKSV